jgi:hypothetical protein
MLMEVIGSASRLSTDKLVCRHLLSVGIWSLDSATPHHFPYPAHEVARQKENISGARREILLACSSSYIQNSKTKSRLAMEQICALLAQSIKQGVSRRAVNAGLIEEILWEPGGGHDRNITSPQAMQNAITYIHMNPVRKELCTNILEYKWSSARTLVLGEIGEIDVDGSDWLS